MRSGRGLDASTVAHACPPTHDDSDWLRYSRDLVERVHREADEACAMPWWFWEVAVILLVVVIISSSVWPMGVAP